MKRKKGIFKKFIVLSLLLNLAISPVAVAISNTVYAENTEKADDVKLADFNLEGIDKVTGKKITKEITLLLIGEKKNILSRVLMVFLISQ